ncbi:MAG: hypothetical protein MJ105_04795 [Lachnospiraceae bacterium]|nr:hypothetical protein [Lachnospiraceae bacterium]
MEDNTNITENKAETKNIVITSESVELNEMQQTSIMGNLEKMQKKQLLYSRVSAVLILILVIGLLSVLPAVFKTLSVAQETMGNMNTALINANDTIIQSQETLDEVSGLISATQSELIDAANKLNSIDFEGLNSAIKDLGDVVAPMAKFFASFGKF